MPKIIIFFSYGAGYNIQLAYSTSDFFTYINTVWCPLLTENYAKGVGVGKIYHSTYGEIESYGRIIDNVYEWYSKPYTSDSEKYLSADSQFNNSSITYHWLAIG